MTYDYLVVGAGLFGAVFAHEATAHGKKCLVIDKRAHIGGNAYTERVDGVQVHRYGAHIFHTDDERVWAYVNRFSRFNRFTNAPVARYKDTIFNLPFNMNTFYKLWGVSDPEKAERIIDTQRLQCAAPRNLEEKALSLVGTDLYETLIKGYTEKQWGRKCTELPAFIIKRLPIRFTWDNSYFNDRFQGIPEGGYTPMIEKMLEGCTIRLQTDYFAHRAELAAAATKTVYTGMLDAYYGYRFGSLSYRTLRFETETLDRPNFQGNAVVNYTDSETPFTRIIEHKHFEYGTQPKTVITREYPAEYEQGGEPYYPINDQRNNKLYAQYRALADQEENTLFGGRLADYRYYDMWQVVSNALDAAQYALR